MVPYKTYFPLESIGYLYDRTWGITSWVQHRDLSKSHKADSCWRIKYPDACREYIESKALDCLPSRYPKISRFQRVDHRRWVAFSLEDARSLGIFELCDCWRSCYLDDPENSFESGIATLRCVPGSGPQKLAPGTSSSPALQGFWTSDRRVFHWCSATAAGDPSRNRCQWSHRGVSIGLCNLVHSRLDNVAPLLSVSVYSDCRCEGLHVLPRQCKPIMHHRWSHPRCCGDRY